MIKKMNYYLNIIKMFFYNCYYYKKNGSIDEDFNYLLNQNELIYKKNMIIRKLSREKILLDEIQYLKKQLPYAMTYNVDDFNKFRKENEIDINYIRFDENNSLFYAVRNGKRLYFSSDLNTYEKVRIYYEYLCYEQTKNSPHKYVDEEFGLKKGSIVVDCGAAEGIFVFDNLDSISIAYLFECDEHWIEALEFTFAEWSDKVVIVKKYVGEETSGRVISLDDYFCNSYIDFLKMDIEGAEEAALSGANELITTGKIGQLAIAAYHNLSDADMIRRKLECSYDIEQTKGYLLPDIERMMYPYFRIGILRARVKKLRD